MSRQGRVGVSELEGWAPSVSTICRECMPARGQRDLPGAVYLGARMEDMLAPCQPPLPNISSSVAGWSNLGGGEGSTITCPTHSK